MKKTKFLFILIFMIFLLTVNIMKSEEETKKNKYIDQKITKKFEEGERNVRVIISMDKEKLNKKNRGIKLFSEQEKDIKNIKKNISKKKIKHTLSKSSFSADLNEKEIQELAEKGYKIEYDWPVKAYLQDSTNQINASSAWNLKNSGINLTGEGQTVCVIDTGVNFAHSDLQGKNLTCNIDCFNKTCVENCSVLDDNGHGTHVSGIVSANGGIKGVAFESNLIGVKVMGSGGEGVVSDVLAGMQWCLDNATKYNISVISMSFGCNETETGYESYCDSEVDTGCRRVELTDKINTAIRNNISVVAATGNDDWTDAVAAPACIKNATAVGSIRKDDSTFDYNRWNLSMLIAPGYAINSTVGCCGDSNYDLKYGTSMATPHVSGAIAIIRQYLQLENINKNPLEIYSLLNDTGKRIYDSGSENNYTRIDIYTAINYFEGLQGPDVVLNEPIENYNSSNRTITFNCSASDDRNLINVSLYLNEILNETNSSGINNTDYVFTKTLSEGNWNWSCEAYDNSSQSTTAETRYLKVDSSAPIFTTIPGNETINYKEEWQGVDFDATDSLSNIDNWFIDDEINFTINSTGYLNNNTKLKIGNYTINVSVNDSLGNTNSTMYNLEVDKGIGMINLLLNGTDGDINFVYRNQINVSAYSSTSQEIELYQNQTEEITNENNIFKNISVGYYNYTAIALENENYTKAVETHFLRVLKNNASCSVNFNITSPQDYGNSFRVWHNCTSTATLYKNDYEIQNNSNYTLGVGNWNFTVLREDNENYTYIRDEKIFVINKTIPVANLLNNTALERSYNGEATIINFTETNSGDSDVNYTLYKDSDTGYLDIGTSDSEARVGYYNYFVGSTEGENYSAVTSLDNLSLNISKAQGEIHAYINNTRENASLELGRSYWINASLVNGVFGVINLSLNGTELNSSDSLNITYDYLFDLSGRINLTATYSGNENYTSDAEIWNININDTLAPTLTYSCTPNLVTQGETITCSCNGSDSGSGFNQSSLSYESNPSSSETGTFQVTCNGKDNTGNSNVKVEYYEVQSDTTTSSSSSSSSGGGGGSYTTIIKDETQDENKEINYTKTYSIDDKDFSEIKKIKSSNFSGGGLKEKERIKLKLKGSIYYIGIIEIENSSVLIAIQKGLIGKSVNSKFLEGQAPKIDLDKDHIPDISIKLNKINRSFVDMDIKYINSKNEAVINDNFEKDFKKNEDLKNILIRNIKSIWFVSLVVVIFTMIIVTNKIILIKKKKKIS